MKSITVAALISTLLITSGSTSEAKTRYLKFRTDIGYVGGKSFDVPGRGQIDFPEVINLQLPGVVQSNNVLYLTNVGAHGSVTTSVTSAKVLDADTDVSAPVPYCLQDFPVQTLDGDVLDYDMTTGFSIDIGYSPNGALGPVSSLNTSVQINTAQLDMTVKMTNPITGIVQDAQTVGSNDTKTTIGVDIDFAQVTLGPQFFFETPLINVTGKAILKSLQALSTRLLADFPAIDTRTDSSNNLWFTHVSKVTKLPTGQTFATFIGDTSQLCIEVGDQFDIYNPGYSWTDPTKPCTSALNGAKPMYMGTVTVQTSSEGFSWGEVTGGNSEASIQKGALVKVKKLVADSKSACLH